MRRFLLTSSLLTVSAMLGLLAASASPGPRSRAALERGSAGGGPVFSGPGCAGAAGCPYVRGAVTPRSEVEMEGEARPAPQRCPRPRSVEARDQV